MTRIRSYLKIKGIGEAVAIACDIPLRLRLAKSSDSAWQKKTAEEDLNYLNKDKKYCDINEPLYKAIELGELLKCLELYGKCKYAKDCWVTRRGFCELKRQKRIEGKGSVSFT